MRATRVDAPSVDTPTAVAVRACGTADSVALVSLRGEFDIETVPEIDSSLRRALGPFFHARHLVMDLSEATLVDSTFISYVVRLTGNVRAEGCDVVLARPRGHVRRVLRTVGVQNVLPIYDSLETALDVALTDEVPMIPPSLPQSPPPDTL